LVKAMAGVIDAIADIAPTAYEENQELGILIKAIGQDRTTLSKRMTTLRSTLNNKRDEVARELYNEMKGEDAEHLYLKAIEAFYRESGLRVDKAKIEFTEELVREAIDPVRRQRWLRSLKDDQPSAKLAQDPGGVLEFVGHMLTPRWGTLLDYQDAYTNQSGSFGLDAVFSSLVDFDYWLDCIPPSARRDQMKLHSRMSQLSGGYMLPIIAYNPWTDLKHNDASLKLVQEAITNYGFIGVKIYPPNGFYPYGNASIDNTTEQPRPRDLEALDQKLEAMFGWCADHQLPVMAHTSQSMGSDNKANLFGGPKGWAALLQRLSSQQKVPIINAGHFGGDEGGNTWTTEFGRLMNTPGGQHLYADVGYWDRLQHCQTPDCLQIKRIKGALTASNQLAKNRIMYGTDWLMSSKQTGWPDYPFLVQQLLQDLLPMDRFFYQNALECFGLNPGGAQYDKIKKRFESDPGGLPDWLPS
ncbi:MAG: hypothetical protein PVG75_10505, partial [Thioalkalispiraceae bacterium]